GAAQDRADRWWVRAKPQERLGQVARGRPDRRLNFGVPARGGLPQITGSDRCAAAERAALAIEGPIEVAFAVVAGQRLAGLDVADCDLRLEPERARVGVAVMVDVAPGVPAQDL